MPGARIVQATRTIEAPASAIFDVLADPSKHPLIDGSRSVHGPTSPSTGRLALGSRFSMRMTIGLPYVTRNRVVEFDEGRRIAWHHPARFVWRYELEPDGGATRVTETFDYCVPWGVLIEPLGWPERNRRAMERTFATIEKLVTSRPASR